jgi:protein phosphatase 1K
MKGTGQFEGIQAGSDGYSSGFGVIAEPSVSRKALSPEDRWIIIASDGLFANQERGGGGGVSNEQAVKICEKNSSKTCKEIASFLIDAAVGAGSTDDVTVIVCKLKE